MSKKKMTTTAQLEDQSEWRKGYDLGAKMALRENGVAIRIGRAILDALDDRYEFKQEEY